MRPYDGIDYQYTRADPEQAEALGIISNILGFRPEINGLDYSLNFFSGGIGIVDRLAIRCRLAHSQWPNVMAHLQLKTLSEMLSDVDWSEDFLWLIHDENPGDKIFNSCCQFVNSNLHAFQDKADSECELLFAAESNVNAWCVVWFCNGHLNYLSFDQG